MPGISSVSSLKSEYEIDTVVTYTCPNGFSRKAICTYDPALNQGFWFYHGKCTGEYSKILFD